MVQAHGPVIVHGDARSTLLLDGQVVLLGPTEAREARGTRGGEQSVLTLIDNLSPSAFPEPYDQDESTIVNYGALRSVGSQT